MINILSVDWDYFVDCTEDERYTMFPDGGNENIDMSLSTMLWSTHYLDTKRLKDRGTLTRSLDELSVLEPEYDVLKSMIRETEGAKTWFADSHMEAYKFVKHILKKGIITQQRYITLTPIQILIT